MSPITHFLAGWMVAQADSPPRSRLIIAVASVAPDLDGLGIIPEVLTRDSARPLAWFTQYHHALGHNVGFAFVVTAVALLLTRSWKTAGLTAASFHLHLFMDVLGARGPDGYQWPIPYLSPFSQKWQWIWHGQWQLNARPNFVITAALLLLTGYLAAKRGFGPAETISRRTDAAFVQVMRHWFGRRLTA